MSTNEREIAIRKRVCGEIINMLNNNILEEYGSEPFNGWCEDGAVFDNEEVLQEDCHKMALKVAPLVDKLSELLAIDNLLCNR